MGHYTQLLCPLCHQGTFGFRQSTTSMRVFLLCDECEAIYLDPAKIGVEVPFYTSQAMDWLIPGTEDSIDSRFHRAARLEDIQKLGWDGWVGRWVPESQDLF